jgi:hypothetical protein
MRSRTVPDRSLMQKLTINPATYEELKYQSLVTLSGNTFPLHFYQWRKDVLNLNQGIPLASQGFYIMTFLEGESKYRVKKALAFTSSPTKEQVPEVLENHYGDIHEIMKKLVAAHKNLGRIPSYEVSWEHMHHIVNEHYRVISSMKELATKVGKEETIHSWSYLDILGKMLRIHEQRKLSI